MSASVPPVVPTFDQMWNTFKVAAVAEVKDFQKRMKADKSDISDGQVRAICERHFGGIEIAKLTEEFVDEVKKAL